MRSQRLFKNEDAFTGLEAAIVLTAFIVVAAVFAYVVLGAGFFTTQKSKEVVHTGVETATSSVELAGSVIAQGNTTAESVVNITIYVQLTAGQNPVDLHPNRTVLSYTDINDHVNDIYTSLSNLTQFGANDTDELLEAGEKFRITVDVSTYDLGINDDFKLELKPLKGATLAIERTIPPEIDQVMDLN